MEILDRIKGLESKIDRLNFRSSFQSEGYSSMPDQIPSATASACMTMSPGIGEPQAATPFQVTDPRAAESQGGTAGADDGYMYASSASEMMGWPAMRRILERIKDRVPGLNPATIEHDGPSIVLGIHEHHPRPPLSVDRTAGLTKTTSPPPGPPFSRENLTWEAMERLSKAYFDSLNFLCPLVDRQVFNSEIIPSLVRQGWNDSMTSTIAMLVFALGELAMSGTEGVPIRVYNGRPSGFKGGTSREPPGLALFNEARARMGFILMECSVENVQAFALAG